MRTIEMGFGVTKRRAKGEAREQLVVGAAAEVIAELGLANVRVADVAERAGMSAGHVTYYFPSKTELLMRAIRQSEERFTDQLETEIQAIRDPWKRLSKLIELAASNGKGDPGWILWFEVWSNAAVDSDVAQVHEELDSRSRAILADVIRYGCDLGDFETHDPDRAALLLSAVIDGLSTQLTLGAGNLTRRGLLRMCSDAAKLHLTRNKKPSASTAK